jgi:hypothetical protein
VSGSLEYFRTMKRLVRGERIVAFSAGLIVAITVNSTMGWWLDGATGVGVMLAAQFAAAFAVAAGSRQGRKQRAISLWTGSLVGIAVSLLFAGPGTLWPLVLIIASVTTAAPVLAGVAVASILERTP